MEKHVLIVEGEEGLEQHPQGVRMVVCGEVCLEMEEGEALQSMSLALALE
jgi:hypothetical protein